MKNLALYIDLVFCLVVLPIMVALSPIERWVHNFTVYMLCAGIWLYLVYFINRAFTVPFLFSDRNKKIGAVILILMSIIVTFIFSGIELYNPKPNVSQFLYRGYLVWDCIVQFLKRQTSPE